MKRTFSGGLLEVQTSTEQAPSPHDPCPHYSRKAKPLFSTDSGSSFGYSRSDTTRPTKATGLDGPVLALLSVAQFSNFGNLYIVAFAGAVAGVFVFLSGFGALQRRRLILNTPTSKIRSAAMGLVEMNGLACGPYTLIAPITGVPCHYYRTSVWQWIQRDKNSGWELAAEERLHVPFYLDDNTGRVLVDPQGAEMDLHCDFEHEYSDSFFSMHDSIPGDVYGFLARNGVGTDKRIKVEEFAIKPKNSLFILGTLAVNTGGAIQATPIKSADSRSKTFYLPTSGFLCRTAARLLGDAANQPITVRVTATGLHGMNTGSIQMAQGAAAGSSVSTMRVADPQKVAAAMMQAGISNPAAWAAAGIAMPGAAVTVSGSNDPVATEQFDLRPPTVLMKGEHNPAFFISWKNQRQVLSTLGWKSTLMIWGGPALTLLSVWFLAARFGWLE